LNGLENAHQAEWSTGWISCGVDELDTTNVMATSIERKFLLIIRSLAFDEIKGLQGTI